VIGGNGKTVSATLWTIPAGTIDDQDTYESELERQQRFYGISPG